MARKKKPPPAAEKPQKKAPSGSLKASYDTKKARTRERDVALSESGRDIGAIPPIVNRDRRDAGRHSFRLFCESYMPATFELAWSPDHLEVIAAVEAAVLRGELLAFAMPRGSGKTSLVEAAALWALLYGHRDLASELQLVGMPTSWPRGHVDTCIVNGRASDVIPTSLALGAKCTPKIQKRCWLTSNVPRRSWAARPRPCVVGTTKAAGQSQRR
jgi:hypothetical protein